MYLKAVQPDAGTLPAEYYYFRIASFAILNCIISAI